MKSNQKFYLPDMNLEDLFKYGVTPKVGPYAGMRFKVTAITPTAVKATLLDGDKDMDDEFIHGAYDIWHKPKTLFEDDSIVATWGNLKKAVEAAGISDDTKFAVQEGASWFYRGLCRPATFSVETLRELYGKPKKYIIVK